MRAVRALFRKELREHGVAVFVLLAVLTVLLILSLIGVQAQGDKTSTLEFIPFYLLTYFTIAAMVLSNRLVVREFQAHTQHFLETLPLLRWQVVALKYALGFLILSLVACGALVAGSLSAVRSEPIGVNFATFMGLRALGYLFWLWSACFFVGFTGRFRQPIFWSFFLILMGTEISTDLSVMDFPPLALVDPSIMPYERVNFPVAVFLQDLLLGGCLMAAAFVIATWREGQLVSQLSGRLTQAEKAAVATILVGYVLAVAVIDEKRPKAPFQFPQDEVLVSQTVPLEILYLSEPGREKAEKLLAWLEPRLKGLEEEVGLKLPRLRVALSESLDGVTYNIANMGKKDGVLIRCNFMDSGFERESMGALLVHQALAYHTRGRAMLESGHWFLDGFSVWWMESPEGRPSRQDEAMWVVREGFPTAEEVERWGLQIDGHGYRGMDSFAYTGILYLEETHGREAVLKLAKLLYNREVNHDIRELFQQWMHPTRSRFLEASGVEFETFVEGWADWFVSQGDGASLLAQLGRPEGQITATKEGLEYSLEFSKAPPKGTGWTLLHITAGPFDAPIAERGRKREEHLWKDGQTSQSKSLNDVYSPGDRVLVCLEVQFPGRAHPFRVVTRRLELP